MKPPWVPGVIRNPEWTHFLTILLFTQPPAAIIKGYV
jgi:hypothetical protein